ncbi:hypothetical protein MKY96_32565 [Paenibacillus sp. FSL R7-0302]
MSEHEWEEEDKKYVIEEVDARNNILFSNIAMGAYIVLLILILFLFTS